MPFLWHLIAVIAMALPNVLGYNLVFGKGKIFHFGPLGVSIVSAYATFLTLMATQNYPLAIAVGFAASCAIALVFAWLALRLEPDGLGVMSIAVHLALIAVVLNWDGLTRGALGVPGIPRIPYLENAALFACTAVAIAAVWAGILWRVQRGPFGRALSALAENEWHARSLGISRQRTYITAFLLGAVGAMLTNMLYPQYLGLLHPSDFLFPHFIFMMMVVVAGKPGSVLGVVISCILLTLLKEGIRFVAIPSTMVGPVRLLLFGMILFAAVWVRRKEMFVEKRSV